ncbi:class A beta-lactamase-related serine hydrolase [Corallococcus interemptor]|uniref:Class A beta-lactamase-related serine hydrolase n=1 Tax=Corallococcus interemptor TaxID=2316720 RepID=A0A3A8QLT6_9BACT|nr:serine hydrolase domain-containing protein [Corallococcus interemptor]RKH69716.1 class A beta-lactamase-related serine hydrolase [Corallococcus interemptor]
MSQAVPRFVPALFLGCSAVVLLTAADAPKPVPPTTQWTARPSESARVARVEARLAPLALPGEKPQSLSVRRWMDLYRIPGLSVAVYDKHARVWSKTYGVTQAGGKEPVTLETLFQAASISKPVTALAALRAVEQGQLSLDANVNDALKCWKVPDNGFTREQKVTLRRLLSHSAGLTVHGFPGYGVGEPLPTLQQILDGQKPANTEAVRVDTVPGTESRYSGGGYVVVQKLLMDVTNKPFPRLMKEAVLDPVGMTHSTFEQPLPPELVARTASGTRASGETVEGRWKVYPELAPAGLWTTPSDLALLQLEVAKAKAGRSQRVLSQAMTRQMLTKQSGPSGLGYRVDDASDRFEHGGWNEGFTATVMTLGDSGSGVVLMANSDNGVLLFERIIASIAAEYGWKPVPDHLKSPEMTADLLSRVKGADAVIAWARKTKGAGLSPQVLGQVGYGMMMSGKTEEGLKVFQENAALFPDDPEAQEGLRMAALKAGKTPGAKP